MERIFDVAIVGAGPAGLTAAITAKAKRPQADIILLEKMPEPAKKLSASGNGRGNLTSSSCQDLPEVLKFFSEAGIATRMDQEGRIYPYSEDAKSVAKTLVQRATGLGVILQTDSKVSSVEACPEGGFRIFVCEGSGVLAGGAVCEGSGMLAGGAVCEGKVARSVPNADTEIIRAKKLLIATGGKSYAIYGSTGDGYAMARGLGHTVTPLVPALTAIEIKEPLKDLKGLRVRGEVTLMNQGQVTFKETGEIQFREDAISGICVMNMSSQLPVKEAGQEQSPLEKCKIMINMVPDFSASNLMDFLKAKASLAGEPMTALALLGTIVKTPMAKRILSMAGIQEELSASALTAGQLLAIANGLRGFTLSPCGKKGWKEAQVTKGGVSLGELDMETMESKLVKGLYIAGETVDYDGPCGGFNLHNAWLTGIRAGKALAK